MSKTSRIPPAKVRWTNTIFLLTTLLLSLSAMPVYYSHTGLSAFQLGLFLFFFVATGLSITLGYHRLFSHLSFKASWPVRLLVLLFGAAAFENSAMHWAADHRRHHRHVDGDEDPYDISKGFFHAHIGWVLFRHPPDTSLVWAKDLQRDRLVVWQHRYYLPIAILMGFALPMALGWLAGGAATALGSFLLAGVTRVVFVHHMTFCINSLCHTFGQQPYSNRCTARDSALMAWLTFGEGYHNFHHAFQHDYRNGVKPWQFDPTKWCIWLLAQTGLVGQLRQVPPERILLAQIEEEHRQMAAALGHAPAGLQVHLQQMLHAAQSLLHQAAASWEHWKAEYKRASEERINPSREKLADVRRELREATLRLREAVGRWHSAPRLVMAHLTEKPPHQIPTAAALPVGQALVIRHCGDGTTTSRAWDGTGVIVVRPPGQRVQTAVARLGVPKTSTGLSCDQ
jgi:stearoyl-CoA desaturase (delta-9 desaturase)